MTNNIENYYIRTVEVGDNKSFRITKKTLDSLYDIAESNKKLPLLNIIIDDEWEVDIEINKLVFDGYVQPKKGIRSFLISKKLIDHLVEGLETSEIFETIDDKDFVWSLSILFKKRS